MLALSNPGINVAESLQARLTEKSVDIEIKPSELVEVKVNSFNPYRKIVNSILTGEIKGSDSLISRLTEVNPSLTPEQIYLTSILVLELARKEIVDKVYKEFTNGIANSKPVNDLVESLKSAADYLDENQLLSLRGILGNEIDGYVNRRLLGDQRYI